MLLSTLCCTLLALGALELLWRMDGHLPTVTDDPDLWAEQRRAVSAGADSTVVLLGSSRMQLGFSTPTFRKFYSQYRLVQLAMDGAPPIAALRDLAEDEGFRGVVVVEVFEAGLQRGARDAQQPLVEHYHTQRSIAARLNRRLASLAQSNLAVLNPALGLRHVGKSWLQGHMPARYYLKLNPDRSYEGDYSLIEDLSALRAHQVSFFVRGAAAPPPPDEWLAEALETEAWVQRIHRRGGRVAFVVFPTSGEMRDDAERRYPRAAYWDRFAAATTAAAVHALDIPGVRQLDVPDTSHLDRTDTPLFTLLLSEELVRHGVIEPPAAPSTADRAVVRGARRGGQ